MALVCESVSFVKLGRVELMRKMLFLDFLYQGQTVETCCAEQFNKSLCVSKACYCLKRGQGKHRAMDDNNDYNYYNNYNDYIQRQRL